MQFDMIFHIGIIYLILIIVVLTMWQLIDKNFQRMQLLETGREAERNTNSIISVMHGTNSYLWYMEDNKLYFGDRFYEFTKLRKRPIPVSVVRRCVEPSQLNEAKEFLYSVTEEGSTIMLDFVMPYSGIRHTLNIKASLGKTEEGTKLIMGIFTLADDTKKLEQERHEAFRLEEESKMKASFLASMGHEIRTPLNVITGFSKLLAEDYVNLSDEERRGYYEIIEENNTQLLKLLNDVLETSTEEGEEIQLQLKKKRVSDLIEELYTTHNVVVPKRLKFYMKQGNTEDFIDINRSCMMQVISNLMNNAIKFTEEGSITLGWESTEDKVVIFVEDTGIGIPEENLEAVFDKFFKQNASSAGAGIGLPLCKRLVRNMHGEIRAKSTLGKGSRFELTFNKS